MSPPDKPPPKGAKPFLDNADLSNELDAWDATFDALHSPDSGDASQQDAAAQPMAWPAPAVEIAPASRPTPIPAERAPLHLDDPELDAQLTLDRSSENTSIDHVAAPRVDRERAPTPTFAFNADPAETDFSELGGAPSALGNMLGSRETDTPLPAPMPMDVDDDGVYTSASRPGSQAPDDFSLPDDPIAAPPPPRTSPPVAPPTKRTGPAIIRRATPVAVPLKIPTVARPDEDSDEATHVGDPSLLAAHARSKAPTAPPPLSFSPSSSAHDLNVEEDDYADIEIGASATAPEAEAPAGPAPRRTAVHVVRRPESRAKPAEVKRESDPVIEVSHEPDGAAPPSGEDDFSDVAAALGSRDELGEPIRPRAPSAPDDEPVMTSRPLNLDDALAGDDDDLAIPAERSAALDSEEIDEGAVESEADVGDDDEYTHDVPIGDLDDMPAFASARDEIPEIADELDRAPRAESQFEVEVEPPDHVDEPERPPERISQTRVDVRGGRPPGVLDVFARPNRPSAVPVLEHVPDRDDLDHGAGHTLAGVRAAPPRVRRMATPLPIGPGDDQAENEPSLDLEALQLPEQVQPLPSSQLDEEFARSLEVYERELETVDEAHASAMLRIEAGRLCERLGELERARSHYDAALLADPRATTALRGLRRLARSSSDLGEAVRQIDAELQVAGALERRPLSHYRIDLLLAAGDQDLARVAAGEVLDSAPSDVRALLAQLELAFLDGRADEFGRALEQLAHAITDPELRGAVQAARGVLASTGDAAAWYRAAGESDPTSLGARLGVIRELAKVGDADATTRALLDLVQQIDPGDPLTAGAIALRADVWASRIGDAGVRGELATAAAQLAQAALPDDPLVARTAAEASLAGADPVAAGMAMGTWAAAETSAAERAYAAGRAAELDPARGAELWSAALLHDPGDDYAAAQLRTAYVASEATQLAIDVDLAVAGDADRERARLRAAFGLIAQSQLEAAIELLDKGHAEHPGSLALTEAYAEALAAAGRWGDRAKLLDELAKDPGEQLDKDVAQLRSALAWEEAVGAVSAAEAPNADDVQTTTVAALGAWDRMLEGVRGPAPAAHAAAISLATRLGDTEVLGEVLARAQAAEPTPWAAATLALRRARLVASDAGGNDIARGEAVLRDLQTAQRRESIDDPRRTAWRVLAAARADELGDAATALDERAAQLDGTREAGALRLRAAQLALDAGDATRATALLARVETDLPSLAIVPDLLAAARRRSGDRPPVSRSVTPATASINPDAFGRIVRDGDLAAAQGDGVAAVALFQRALELRPGDPLAAVPLQRAATLLREPGPITALALGQLRGAETAGDSAAKANAYELLAFVDQDLRADRASAQIALESAAQADPSRVDLMHRLEREYAATDQLTELLRLRRAESDQLPLDLAKDRAALVMDAAALAERDQRPDAEITELYRAALAADPKHRLALLGLESIVRRAGASPELAGLEDQIAAYFEGDPRAQAAFYTRAGETLAEIGQIDSAVQKFGTADEIQPGHVPALEGWRAAALKGQLWIDVAQAASRQAKAATDSATKATLYHFAGVALMDKALEGGQATAAFKQALVAEPGHKDSFLRLRILLDEDAAHDELAIVLANRLEFESDERTRIELHRAIAELHRNFLDSRDIAKQHYRQILESDPNDLRAHAAVADIAWEQGNWQEAAEALVSRARLEHDRNVLTTLCYRLGLIYADRLNEPTSALKAFQRALTYVPDDENTLIRLADLATQTGEWKLALGACERLVKAEQDPDKRAAHLHRVARIFKQGFNDAKRAERALNLALDGAPTNDEALTRLVEFYRDAGDMTSVRVHLNRVAGTMRVRVGNDPKDGVAYRVIARAMAARSAAGVDGSLPVARAAAELATLLGAAGEPERLLLSEPVRVDLAPLVRPDSDDLLFPRTVQTELRQLFTLLGDRLAKHVGIDLRSYGVGRGDRLRAKDSKVAAHAQDVASGLGFGEIDVYVSTRQPWAMVAEPTSPVSLVLGQSIAQADTQTIRFAAGAALKLARASLAIPARLGETELGVLVVALLRLFQADFPQEGLEEAAIATQAQKLRRLIPTGLMNELKPFALAVDAPHFRHEWLARDLRVAGLRAGLVASGSLLAGLQILAKGGDVAGSLGEPIAQGLISFALGEDHAALGR
ncbi:MAG TPA: tetratricopeptide repeat protein [Kofleriaceae bacterium]|jgi:tetratricopeptide (TPR) repeat protein